MNRMEGLMRLIIRYRAYLMLVVASSSLAAIVHYSGQSFFQSYFGIWNPSLIVFASGVLGLTCLIVLSKFPNLQTSTTSAAPQWRVIAGLALIFGTSAIVVDIVLRLPSDINVPFPWSLIFYPVIALVAETAFHLIPMTLLLLFISRMLDTVLTTRTVTLCLLLVAGVEPVFHIYDMVVSEASTASTIVAVTLLIYGFNVAQLWLYRRYGFLAMIALRWAHYFLWHIAWGYWRLQIAL